MKVTFMKRKWLVNVHLTKHENVDQKHSMPTLPLTFALTDSIKRENYGRRFSLSFKLG